MDITGGLPRVTEIFEARKPKDPAVLAEISGTVELRSDKRRGKMTIIVRNESGMEKEHHVPQDKELQVHAGDYRRGRRCRSSAARSFRTTSSASRAKNRSISTC